MKLAAKLSYQPNIASNALGPLLADKTLTNSACQAGASLPQLLIEIDMTEQTETATEQVVLPGEQAQALMTELASWRNTTTIVIVAGCVFEFKGVFPLGSIAEGYYNLALGEMGFSGHIKLQAIASIKLLERQHRGMASYAFIFEDRKGQPIFKVYLGRDDNHVIHPEQLEKFEHIKNDGLNAE